jgi:predicted SAM-dependent methyltransferase
MPRWVNVDLIAYPSDLPWNLRRPLPFDDGTIDAVFHEHVLEHFPLDQSLFLMRKRTDCFEQEALFVSGCPTPGLVSMPTRTQRTLSWKR